jgi:hypothetical protein
MANRIVTTAQQNSKSDEISFHAEEPGFQWTDIPIAEGDVQYSENQAKLQHAENQIEVRHSDNQAEVRHAELQVEVQQADYQVEVQQADYQAEVQQPESESIRARRVRFEIGPGGGIVILVGLLGLSAAVFFLGMISERKMTRSGQGQRQLVSVYPMPLSASSASPPSAAEPVEPPPVPVAAAMPKPPSREAVTMGAAHAGSTDIDPSKRAVDTGSDASHEDSSPPAPTN